MYSRRWISQLCILAGTGGSIACSATSTSRNTVAASRRIASASLHPRPWPHGTSSERATDAPTARSTSSRDRSGRNRVSIDVAAAVLAGSTYPHTSKVIGRAANVFVPPRSAIR